MRPISRTIAIWLSTIILISGVLIGMFYSYVLVDRNNNEYLRNINSQADLIANELAVDLWTYNQNSIQHICQTAINLSHIEAIEILEGTRTRFFSKGEISNPAHFLLERDIEYQERVIGQMKVAFAQFDPIPIWIRTLVTTIAILLPVLITSILLTFFILNRFLSDPLKDLLRGIKLISDGKFQNDFSTKGGLEVALIADSVKILSKKLCHRETKLKENEQKLRESLEKYQVLNETLEQRVAERTAALENRTQQLQQLAMELSDAEDRERRHIASILHDDFQQQLAYVNVELSIILKNNADKEVGQKLGLLKQLIGECIENSRHLSYEINPPALHRNGLLAALEALVQDMKDNHGLWVELSTQPGAEPNSLTLASILYRSARELLLNVVKHADVETAFLDVLSKNGMIRIRVEDFGDGFDYEAVRSRQGRGSGFGLYNIEDRINFVGGSIKFKTAPGKGCCVVLTVPQDVSRRTFGPAPQPEVNVKPELMKIEPTETKQPFEDGEQIRILLADDHQLMREALAKLLQSCEGLTIVGQAIDGREVVQLATQLKPQVILMDVAMPERDGFEATALIKRVFPDIRIIGLSTHNDADTRQKMLDAGASAYITKTSSPDILVKTILQVYHGNG